MLSDALNHAYLFEIIDSLSSKSPTTTLAALKPTALFYALPKDLEMSDLDPADQDGERTEEEEAITNRVALLMKVDMFHYVLVDCEDHEAEVVIPLAVVEEQFHCFMDLRELADAMDEEEDEEKASTGEDEEEDEDEEDEDEEFSYEMQVTLKSGREVTVVWDYDDAGEIVLDPAYVENFSEEEKQELIEAIKEDDEGEEDEEDASASGYVEGQWQMVNIFAMMQGLQILEHNIRAMAADSMEWLEPAMVERDELGIGDLFFSWTEKGDFLLFQSKSATEILVLTPESPVHGQIVPASMAVGDVYPFDAVVSLALSQDAPDEDEDDEEDEDEGEDDFDEDYVPPPAGTKRVIRPNGSDAEDL